MVGNGSDERWRGGGGRRGWRGRGSLLPAWSWLGGSCIGQEGGHFGLVRTVIMMPFPALDRWWTMLDANVRKVDWDFLAVTTGWWVGPTSFSTTRIHDMSEVSTACTSLTSSIRCGCCYQSSFVEMWIGSTASGPRQTMVPSGRIKENSPATRPFAAAVLRRQWLAGTPLWATSRLTTLRSALWTPKVYAKMST